VPRRRCVGCGRVAPKPELVRLAVAAGAHGEPAPQVVIDPTGTLPGRGAYLCRGTAQGRPAAECLALATGRGGVARALRRRVRLDATRLLGVGPEIAVSGARTRRIDESTTVTDTAKTSR
jgi:predicted RNA-binding protein YlxR (DUF448 family)